jgi:hypothetical protein
MLNVEVNWHGMTLKTSQIDNHVISHDIDSTLKMSPGNVPYVICRCHLIHPILVIFTKLAVTKVQNKM